MFYEWVDCMFDEFRFNWTMKLIRMGNEFNLDLILIKFNSILANCAQLYMEKYVKSIRKKNKEFMKKKIRDNCKLKAAKVNNGI